MKQIYLLLGLLLASLAINAQNEVTEKKPLVTEAAIQLTKEYFHFDEGKKLVKMAKLISDFGGDLGTFNPFRSLVQTGHDFIGNRILITYSTPEGYLGKKCDFRVIWEYKDGKFKLIYNVQS